MRISDWSSDVCSSDLLFKGVTVVDGSGAAAFAGDVAVTEGRIAAAAPTLDGEADEAIEGRGRVLAPGFIDVHTRSEEHTSELQSLMRISYAVFCLKKKKQHSPEEPSYTSINQPEQNTQMQKNT